MNSSSQRLPTLSEVRAEKSKRSLRDFIEFAWKVVEPATPYSHGWHIDAISEHLEAVTRGEIKRLLINVPPRHMKSLTVCVFWPAWEWLTKPETRWLFSSYALDLALRDSVRCRRLIQSPEYIENWGDLYRLTSDQNMKSRFENDKSGVRLIASVDSGVTGEGGDRIIVDDPHNVRDIRSDATRKATLQWWRESMSTRGNNPATVAKVVIMQRLHQDDLAGNLISEGGWDTLILPAEYEVGDGVKKFTSIGWSDPRSEAGELLWPEHFGREALDTVKKELVSPYTIAAQLQQRPVPEGGAMFREEWFRVVQSVPPGARRIRYWDKAATAGSGDYSAGVLIAKLEVDGRNSFYIEDVVRGRWSSHRRNVVMETVAREDRARYGYIDTWIEQEPGASGKESAEISINDLAGYSIHKETASGDKVVRAGPLASQAEGLNVCIVEGLWNDEYMLELTFFPYGKYDDQVDASSGAFNKLALIKPGGAADHNEEETFTQPGDVDLSEWSTVVTRVTAQHVDPVELAMEGVTMITVMLPRERVFRDFSEAVIE